MALPEGHQGLKHRQHQSSHISVRVTFAAFYFLNYAIRIYITWIRSRGRAPGYGFPAREREPLTAAPLVRAPLALCSLGQSGPRAGATGTVGRWGYFEALAIARHFAWDEVAHRVWAESWEIRLFNAFPCRGALPRTLLVSRFSPFAFRFFYLHAFLPLLVFLLRLVGWWPSSMWCFPAPRREQWALRSSLIMKIRLEKIHPMWQGFS